jgi:AcrR family transcriptional regulator
MPRRTSKGPSSERFIDETLKLIAEKGGSRDVNLREISRRVGCAHTNVYNYFTSLDDLLWAAFRRGLGLYGEAMSAGLDDSLSGHAYFRRLIGNLVGFAAEKPGLHRFLSSDPMDPEQIPEDVVSTAMSLKAFYLDGLAVLCGDRVAREDIDRLGDIVLAYIDGETFNLINGRVLPGDDIVGRVVDNAERLFTLLTSRTSDGIDLDRDHDRSGEFTFPRLEVSQ